MSLAVCRAFEAEVVLQFGGRALLELSEFSSGVVELKVVRTGSLGASFGGWVKVFFGREGCWMLGVRRDPGPSFEYADPGCFEGLLVELEGFLGVRADG